MRQAPKTPKAKRMAKFDGEPRLAEMLDDPVIQAVMARDGVVRRDIERLVARMAPRTHAATQNCCV